MEKWKFLTRPGLELRPLRYPVRSQSLYRLRYPGSLLPMSWRNYKFNFIWILQHAYCDICSQEEGTGSVHLRYETVIVVVMMIPIFWDITTCSLLRVNRYFRDTCVHLQGGRVSQTGNQHIEGSNQTTCSWTLNMEVIIPSKLGWLSTHYTRLLGLLATNANITNISASNGIR
jgi:hypothetical protein